LVRENEEGLEIDIGYWNFPLLIKEGGEEEVLKKEIRKLEIEKLFCHSVLDTESRCRCVER